MWSAGVGVKWGKFLYSLYMAGSGPEVLGRKWLCHLGMEHFKLGISGWSWFTFEVIYFWSNMFSGCAQRQEKGSRPVWGGQCGSGCLATLLAAFSNGSWIAHEENSGLLWQACVGAMSTFLRFWATGSALLLNTGTSDSFGVTLSLLCWRAMWKRRNTEILKGINGPNETF